MSNKTMGPGSPYRQDPPGQEKPPAPPKPMYMLGLTGDTTPDYLDPKLNGGPDAFQIINMQTPQGAITKFILGRTVWDHYAAAAMAEIIAATVTRQDGTLSAPDAKDAARIAAAFADALIEEKRQRDPQRMVIEAPEDKRIFLP
jgi:hypothetical protein